MNDQTGRTSGIGRGMRRLFVVAATSILVILVGSTAAQAATSGILKRNAGGAYQVEVWYNSGTHNMSKGRNSFTLKDHICNDGYSAYVYWSGATSGSRSVSCGEISFSTAGDVARTSIGYYLCAIYTNGSYSCSATVYDYQD
jgi:hypothetical protein